MTLAEQIHAAAALADDKIEFVEQLKQLLHDISPLHHQPVDYVRWVPISMVTPNDYNPNSVARIEMKLLYTSIAHDRYTQPIVTIWNAERGLYEIVDGFHRYFVCKSNPDILEATQGRLPIVVIQKDINDRMASTVRHNRARGKHSVDGMASMVFQMLDNGWDEASICNELGMEPEEVLRLKHITGFSKLFADVEYKKTWLTRRQIQLRQKARNGSAEYDKADHRQAVENARPETETPEAATAA